MTSVSVKIPGKVMLAGEYSVLFGGSALAATVKNQMEVTATTHTDGRCLLRSAMWKKPIDCATDETSQGIHGPLLEAALLGMKRNNINGAAISISGNLKPEYGFGSSSALRLGTSVALKSLSTGIMAETYWDEAKEAYLQQKNAQQQASGYDIVTQYVGGVALFNPAISEERVIWPGRITLFPKRTIKTLNSIVHVFVGGKGAPTTKTMQGTLSWLEDNQLMPAVVAASEHLIEAFKNALNRNGNSLDDLIRAAAAVRTIFSHAPAFPDWLTDLFDSLPGFDETFTVKTTGAGGEDAILLIGNENAITAPAALLVERGWRQLKKPFACAGTSVQITTALEEGDGE